MINQIVLPICLCFLVTLNSVINAPLDVSNKLQSSTQDLNEFYDDQPHLIGKPKQNDTNVNEQKPQSEFELNALQAMFHQLPTEVQNQLLRLPGFAEGIQMVMLLSQFGQFGIPGTDPSAWASLLGDFNLPFSAALKNNESQSTTATPINL